VKNSTSEIYDPENVVRSEQVSEETKEGSTPEQVGGVPGTVSNIGPLKGLSSNKTTESYSKNTGTTNYEIGKTVSTTKSQFARIKRITAAVIVDGKYKVKIDENGEASDDVKYVSLNESDLNALTSLVSRAIGINQDRGDVISVQNLQFDRTKTAPAIDSVTQSREFIATYLTPFSEVFKYIFVLILLLILYKKVISPFAGKMLEVSKDEEGLASPILAINDEEEDLVEKVQQMRKKVEDQLGVSENFNEDELKYEVILDKVRNMADEGPEDIASLLQSLLVEEADGNFPRTSM
jgi:flagellar M-ring protein FliF